MTTNACLVALLLFVIGYAIGYRGGKIDGLREFGWHDDYTRFENSISMMKLLMLYGYPIDEIMHFREMETIDEGTDEDELPEDKE